MLVFSIMNVAISPGSRHTEWGESVLACHDGTTHQFYHKVLRDIHCWCIFSFQGSHMVSGRNQCMEWESRSLWLCFPNHDWHLAQAVEHKVPHNLTSQLCCDSQGLVEPQAASSPLDLSSLAPMLSKKQTIVLTPAGPWFDGTKLLTMVLPQTCECQKRLWWNPGFQEDESHLHVCSNGHPWSWGYPKLWFQNLNDEYSRPMASSIQETS